MANYSRHTSGPWIVAMGGMRPTITTADESIIIALLPDCGEEMEANAALMAAAPAMLAALRAAETALRYSRPQADHYTEAQELHRAALAEIVAVRARATRA